MLGSQDASARAYEMELEVRCGMCLEVCNDLRLLPCLHSFCGDCLQAAVAAAEGGRVACPICKVCVCVSQVYFVFLVVFVCVFVYVCVCVCGWLGVCVWVFFCVCVRARVRI